jgi:hypothetical protein
VSSPTPEQIQKLEQSAKTLVFLRIVVWHITASSCCSGTRQRSWCSGAVEMPSVLKKIIGLHKHECQEHFQGDTKIWPKVTDGPPRQNKALVETSGDN